MKEQLHGFAQEETLGNKGRLERGEAGVVLLKDKIPLLTAPFMTQIKILTSMKGW